MFRYVFVVVALVSAVRCQQLETTDLSQDRSFEIDLEEGTSAPDSQMMDCVTSCLSSLYAQVGTTKDSICTAYDDYQNCIRSCPSGDQIWSMAKSMVPTTFSQIESFCSDPSYDDFNMRNHSNPGYSCAADCSEGMNLQAPTLGLLCQQWDIFSSCVLRCPDGVNMMAEARSMMRDAFSVIEQHCSGSYPVTVDYLDYSNFALGSPHLGGFTSEDDELTICVNDCVKNLMNTMDMKTQSGICGAYEHYELCVRSCPEGDSIWEEVQRSMPATLSYIESFCADPTYANVELTSTSGGPALTCFDDCRGVLNLNSMSVIPLCDSYTEYRNCVENCPDGEAALSMAEEMVPDAVKMIDNYCKTPSTSVLRVDAIDYNYEETDVVQIGRADYIPASDNNGDTMACVLNCVQTFTSDLSELSQEEICARYSQYGPCIKQCPMGEEVYKQAKAMFSDAFETLDAQCSDSASVPTTSVGSEAKNCVQEYRCIDLFSGSLTTDALSVCTAFARFEECVEQCPDGSAAMEKLQQFLPKSFGTINDYCGLTTKKPEMKEPSEKVQYDFLQNADSSSSNTLPSWLLLTFSLLLVQRNN